MPTMEPKPAFQSREAAELAERRKPTYVHLSSAPGTSSSVIPWLVALLLALATLAAGLYAARFEHFLSFDSEQIEHTAQSELGLRGARDVARLEHHPNAHVEAHRPAAGP